MKKVAILGATGSIGRQTIEVIEAHSDLFEVCALSCHGNIDACKQLARRVDCNTIIWSGEEAVEATSECAWTYYTGADCLTHYAEVGDYDILVVAVWGIAGLKPTLCALERGKTVALANKETLVCGGQLVMDALRFGGALLPIDSEHCAIHQCLRGVPNNEIQSLTLTCSGGALRDMPLNKLSSASKEDVLAHPNWNMGAKITVDCATMLNKAYEVVEAHYLFGVDYKDIQVLIHKESIVHSMVTTVDGSVLMQCAVPDMRLPIQYALTYPARLPSPVPPLALTKKPLTFGGVEEARYPCFALAMHCIERGTRALVALNAADEIAVGAFLSGRLPFGGIQEVLKAVTDGYSGDVMDIDEIYAIDEAARQKVYALLG